MGRRIRRTRRGSESRCRQGAGGSPCAKAHPTLRAGMILAMSAVATPSLPQPSHRSAVAFWPVLAWLVLQVLALMAAAFRVPFSARFPALGEQLAVQEMLVVQIIGSALLFPLLFRTLS